MEGEGGRVSTLDQAGAKSTTGGCQHRHSVVVRVHGDADALLIVLCTAIQVEESKSKCAVAPIHAWWRQQHQHDI
jgi:hypothetical protein